MPNIITYRAFMELLTKQLAVNPGRVPYEVLTALQKAPVSTETKHFLDCRLRSSPDGGWFCHIVFNAHDEGHVFICKADSPETALQLAIMVYNADDDLRNVLWAYDPEQPDAAN